MRGKMRTKGMKERTRQNDTGRDTAKTSDIDSAIETEMNDSNNHNHTHSYHSPHNPPHPPYPTHLAPASPANPPLVGRLTYPLDSAAARRPPSPHDF